MLRKFSIKECQNNYKNNQMKESFEEDDLFDDDFGESAMDRFNASGEGDSFDAEDDQFDAMEDDDDFDEDLDDDNFSEDESEAYEFAGVPSRRSSYLESLRNKRNAYREGFDYKELARQLDHIRAVHNPDVDLWGVVMALISSYGYDVTGSGYEEEFDPEQIEDLENNIGIYKDYLSKQIPNLKRKICPLAKKLLPSYDFTWMDE
jgi:hypothetical protein